MSIDVSKTNLEDLNSLFLDKYQNYLSLMNNFMSEEAINERKEIVLRDFNNKIKTYFLKKDEHDYHIKKYDEYQKDIRFLDAFAQIDYEYETIKNSLEEIFESEITFLNYITTDFSLNNGETHGLLYKSSDGTVHHDGINKAITYSIINTVAVGKDDSFEYPKEMESNEEISLYQVKDALAIDMMDVFGLGIVEDYFLGNGVKFNDNFRHAFMVYSTTEGEYPTDEEIAKRTLQNMKDFEEGVDKSFKKNDESFYSNYVNMMKKLKGIVKTTNFEYADEVYEKTAKGLK